MQTSFMGLNGCFSCDKNCEGSLGTGKAGLMGLYGDGFFYSLTCAIENDQLNCTESDLT